jgi:7-cyano-7-deazaguanine reductase
MSENCVISYKNLTFIEQRKKESLSIIMNKIKPIETNKDKIKHLETFSNSFPKRNYLIVHRTDEFTSVCPKTGQPDFGKITISYIADKKCIELKSLKFYLQSFRSEGIFYENVTNRVLEDLVKTLKPKWLEVKGEFSTRGGIQSTIIATHGKRKVL